MAAAAPRDSGTTDMPTGDAPTNSCCQVWVNRYSKTEERRIALKKAVQILQRGHDDIQAENLRLKKAYDKELALADVEKNNRVSLENQISALNSEISYLKQVGQSDVQDRDEEIMLLKASLSEGEKEISHLKELYENEKKRADLERKKADAKKKKASKGSKSKANAAEEDKVEEIALLQKQVSEGEKEINRLKELYEKEKKRADLEKKKAEANKKKAGKVSESKASEEDRDEEIELLQKRVSEGEKEINKLKKLYEKEKRRADLEKKKAEANNKKAGKVSKCKADVVNEESNLSMESKGPQDYMLQLEASQREVDHLKSKLTLESNKFEEAIRKLEAETKIVAEERERADLEMAKSEELRKVLEATSKKTTEEMLRADNLCEQLETYGKRIEELEKMITADAEIRLKESSEKVSLENKISILNSEIISLIDKGLLEVKGRDEEIKLLRAHVSEKDDEINHLKLLYENKKEMTDSEKKNVEESMRESAGASESLQAEKGKAAKERRPTDIEQTSAGDYMLQLEVLKNEVNQVKSQLVLEASRFEELRKELLIEKQKVTQERKRAGMEMAKAKEERKHAEANRKKATEAKLHAENLSMQLVKARERVHELEKKTQDDSDQISMQLEEAMMKIGTLQKQIQEDSQCGKKTEKEMNAKIAEIKFLKKQLKFEKMQVKHAKDVAMMEKGRSCILQQEIDHLKAEVVQILHRLDVSTKYFLNPLEHIRDLQKDDCFSNRRNLKEKLCSLNTSQPFLRNKNQFPLSGGILTEPTSGIDSKLDPLLGGSNQKVLKSSAIHSSTASFSDRQLVGSQGRGALTVTTSAQLGEENFSLEQSVADMSGDVANRCNENLAVVADNTVKSCLPIDTGNTENGLGRKRKRIVDAVESIENLCSEGKKLHLQLEDKLSYLHGMLNRKMGKPSEEAEHVGCYQHGGLDVDGDIQAEKMESSPGMVSKDPSMVREASQLGDHLTKDVLHFRGAMFGSATNVKGTLVNFEDLPTGDYMKLLDLDNSADEECYRIASQMPLSPTLPDIPFQEFELPYAENIKTFTYYDAHEWLNNQKENVASSHSFDVMSVEIESNKSKSLRTDYSPDLLKHANEGAFSFTDNLLTGDNGSCGRSSKSLGNHPRKSGCVYKMCKTAVVPDLADEHRKISSESKMIFDARVTPMRLVVSPDIKDSSSICRIVRATRKCVIESSLATETELALPKILVTIRGEDIIAKEMACVFFSLLLLNFTALLGGGNLKEDLIPCLESFSRHINQVILNAKAGNFLSELCSDELLGVMKNFLVDGRVMVYDASSRESTDCGSRLSMLVDGVNVTLSSEAASTEELVAGSIILASVCTAVGRTGFVCEVACNILRMHRYNTFVVLTVLHVFAFFGGEMFLGSINCSLVSMVVKSIVMHLEAEDTSIQMGCLFSSAREANSDFVECLFSRDTLPVDDVTFSLLEKLQKFSKTRITQPVVMESTPESCIRFQMDKGEANSTTEERCDFLNLNCDSSSCLLKQRIANKQSETAVALTLCDTADVLSLLELIACNMSWDWTYNIIISRLLRMLELPFQVDDIVAISILVGHLGRLGVGAVGCEDERVQYLISQLSALLRRETTRACLPLQITILAALLALLSLEFKKVIQVDFKLSGTAAQFVPADEIRNWYHSLNEEQQVLSIQLISSFGVLQTEA